MPQPRWSGVAVRNETAIPVCKKAKCADQNAETEVAAAQTDLTDHVPAIHEGAFQSILIGLDPCDRTT